MFPEINLVILNTTNRDLGFEIVIPQCQMVHFFNHLINMQIMQTPQQGFLGTYQIFNNWQNEKISFLHFF